MSAPTNDLRRIIDATLAAHAPSWTVRDSEAETGSLLVSAPGCVGYSLGVTHSGVVWLPVGATEAARELAGRIRGAVRDGAL